MITLKTVKKEEACSFFEKENLQINESSFCLCAKDGQEVLGYSLFDIENKKMIIRATEPQNDLMLLDGVLRSTLHVAASRNVTEAIWGDKAPEKLFKTLGFIKEENKLNIEKLYESGCSCCKQKADSD